MGQGHKHFYICRLQTQKYGCEASWSPVDLTAAIWDKGRAASLVSFHVWSMLVDSSGLSLPQQW